MTVDELASAFTSVPGDVSRPSQVSGFPDPSAANPLPPPADISTTRSPTDPLTSTPTASATETAIPTGTPTATATEVPTPTSSPMTTPTVTPLPEGWVFSGVRVSPEQGESNLLLYGDVLNNTGSSQELVYITGIFYDAQGQVVTDEDTIDYWPVDVIPPGGRLPFELTVSGIQSAANFDLRVEAEPSGETPRQDFEFLNLDQSNQAAYYCVTGKLRNPDGELQDYLSIVVVLYDSQDNVINFSDYYKHYPKDLVDDQTMDFQVCVDPLNQDVFRYELRAWGL